MIKENRENISSVRPEDFFIEGNYEMPESAIFVVPEDDEIVAEQENRNVNTISYKGDDVRDYIEQTRANWKIRI